MRISSMGRESILLNSSQFIQSIVSEFNYLSYFLKKKMSEYLLVQYKQPNKKN